MASGVATDGLPLIVPPPFEDTEENHHYITLFKYHLEKKDGMITLLGGYGRASMGRSLFESKTKSISAFDVWFKQIQSKT